MRHTSPAARLIRSAIAITALLVGGHVQARAEPDPTPDAFDGPSMPLDALAPRLAVGDVLFIRVTARPFREVADATGSWTNHVGVIVDIRGAEPLVAESTFPLSRRTPLSRFVARSEGARLAIRRLASPLSAEQAQRVREAADRRMGVFYDTGFNLQSQRQFCSRFVREVLADATGVTLGEVETFAHLLARRPDTNLGFWRAWYFGRIPWQRQTVTPASLLLSRELVPVHDSDPGTRPAASDPTLIAYQ